MHSPSFCSFKIANVVDPFFAIGEKTLIKINKIIVGHSRNVIGHQNIGICLLIRGLSAVVYTCQVSNVVGEYGRIALPHPQIVKKAVEHL